MKKKDYNISFTPFPFKFIKEKKKLKLINLHTDQQKQLKVINVVQIKQYQGILYIKIINDWDIR